MSNENLDPAAIPTVAGMLRVTAGNTAAFMEQVAEHIDKLEAEIVKLQQRVTELEESQK